MSLCLFRGRPTLFRPIGELSRATLTILWFHLVDVFISSHLSAQNPVVQFFLLCIFTLHSVSYTFRYFSCIASAIRSLARLFLSTPTTVYHYVDIILFLLFLIDFSQRSTYIDLKMFQFIKYLLFSVVRLLYTLCSDSHHSFSKSLFSPLRESSAGNPSCSES